MTRSEYTVTGYESIMTGYESAVTDLEPPIDMYVKVVVEVSHVTDFMSRDLTNWWLTTFHDLTQILEIKEAINCHRIPTKLRTTSISLRRYIQG